VNDLNELSSAAWAGTLTVAGTTTIPATNVTVNGLSASRYADGTFALGGFTPGYGEVPYTAIAQDASGHSSTNSVTVTVLSSGGFNYDQNGNLTGNGARNFAYDDENELIAVWVASAWSNSFAYDGKMRRRIERDYSWNAVTSQWAETNEVHFIYDGNVVVEERNANNVPLASYTRGNDLSGSLQGAGGIGGLVARTTYGQELPGAPTTAFYHADGNGNVAALIYPDQQLAAKYLYDPFGNMLAMSGPLANFNKYRFSSKEWDDNSGLYYYGYRFYDSGLQKWLNRDPLGELGFETAHVSRESLSIRQLLFESQSPQIPYRGSPQLSGTAEPNLFEFVGNDAPDYVDTDGMGVWGTIKGIGGFLGNNWGKLSAAVATVCLVGPADKCAQLWQAEANAQNAYNNEVNELNGRFGGDWPADIQNMMANWHNSILDLIKEAAAACIVASPGSSFSGPINNPVKM